MLVFFMHPFYFDFISESKKEKQKRIVTKISFMSLLSPLLNHLIPNVAGGIDFFFNLNCEYVKLG